MKFKVTVDVGLCGVKCELMSHFSQEQRLLVSAVAAELHQVVLLVLLGEGGGGEGVEHQQEHRPGDVHLIRSWNESLRMDF